MTIPNETLISLKSIHKEYRSNDFTFSFPRRGDYEIRAVDDVSLSITRGEILGLVGESGSGKTTLGRVAMGVIEPTHGSVFYRGSDIKTFSGKELKQLRMRTHLIYQNPYASLDPKMSIFSIIEEPMAIHRRYSKIERAQKVRDLLKSVGLGDLDASNVFPHQLSGGQRQRIAIARALCLEPEFIVADEPTASLDVSTQASILNLLSELARKLELTILLISHDLGVIRYLCERIAVMYLGKIVELAPTEELFRNPRHPYTMALLSAIPVPNPMIKNQPLLPTGEIPSSINLPKGCRFNTRCPFGRKICHDSEPVLESVDDGHSSACYAANDNSWVPSWGSRPLNQGVSS